MPSTIAKSQSYQSQLSTNYVVGVLLEALNSGSRVLPRMQFPTSEPRGYASEFMDWSGITTVSMTSGETFDRTLDRGLVIAAWKTLVTG